MVHWRREWQTTSAFLPWESRTLLDLWTNWTYKWALGMGWMGRWLTVLYSVKNKERASAEKRKQRNRWRCEERSGVLRASQVVLVVKNPSTNAGDIRDVGSILGCKDPLEEGTATHSSILAWRIPWTEGHGGLQSTGSQRLSTHELRCWKVNQKTAKVNR